MDAHILVFTIACAFTATLVATAPERQKREIKCDSQADIVFLLDSSGSVAPSDFQIMLQFVKGVVKNFEIGPNNVQIGVIKFGINITTEFQLNTYSDGSVVDAAVSRIMYIGGGTPTGDAIRVMRTNSFTSAQGDRPSVPNIGIVVTDGSSNNPTETALESKQSRDAGVVMMAVGVGGYWQQELNDIATDPDSDHVFEAKTFDSLAGIIDRLSNKACEDLKPPEIGFRIDIEFPNENGAPYTYYPLKHATTNGGILTVNPSSFIVGPPPIGGSSLTVVYTVTGASGNKADSGPVVFHIKDTTSPSIVCDGKRKIEFPNENNPAYVYNPINAATTNEGVLLASPASFEVSAPPAGGTSERVVFNAKDKHGNTDSCTVDFEIVDTTAPVLTCSKKTIEFPNENTPLYTYNPKDSAISNEGGITWIPKTIRIGPPETGGTTWIVAFTARDRAGNTASCVSEFLIQDTTPPTLNCSSAVYIEFPSENGAPYQYDPSGFATTNEGMLMAKPSSFEVGPPAVGGDTKTVEFTAKDRSGNSVTCSVAFNIQDTTPPVLKCPTNVILEVICKTNETIDSRDYITTNEGVLTSNVTALTIGIANVGASVPIEITAKDRHGNTESCVVTFTVSDPCEKVSTSTCQKGTPCGPLGNKYPNCGSGHLCCPCTVGAPGNGQGNRPTHFCNVDPSCPAQDKKQNGSRKPPA